MNKWHKRSHCKILSALLALGVLLTPMHIFNKQLARPAAMQCEMDEMCMASLAQEVKDNNMQMLITPESLMGLRLDELLRIVIESALETHTLHELPMGVLRCYEQLENGAKSLHVQDLAIALPVVVEKLTQMMKTERAPRPDAPGNTDGAPVGTVLECNFNEVLQLLNRLTMIVTQCCSILQQDFAFTWTILADIKSSLTTCCADIQVDFNGVFTSIAAIDMDFNSIFTAISDVKNTLTTCCADIEVNFEGTFTSLTDIRNSLTTCCADIQVDFNGVFTAIASITESFTVVVNINDTLTACCSNIVVNFDSTFTTLFDIESTLTTCCAKIQVDFNDTWTILADIKQTITTDFNGTFTTLAAIVISACDLSGVYTTLADINQTITTDFNGTFTAIAAIVAGSCDLTGVYTSINEVFVTLTSCACDVLGNLADNPPNTPPFPPNNPWDDLPSSIDTLSTTTFDVIQWLKSIYIRLGQLSGY